MRRTPACLFALAAGVLGACGGSSAGEGNLHRPTVGPIPAQVTLEDTPLMAVEFTVADIETPVGDLVVAATSSDQALVRDQDITIDGDGATRTLTVVPVANASGAVRIAVSVSDPDFTGSLSFELVITPVNDAPDVTGQRSVATDEDVAFDLVATDLVIDDPDDDAFELAVGDGDNYTVVGSTITPAPDFSGTLSIPVTVSDGEASAMPVDVEVTVRPINDPPTIDEVTGGPFVTDEDVALTFEPGDFAISDVDSTAFTIVVKEGSDYAADGASAVPAAEFSGTLSVSVAISDGESESEPVAVVVAVAPVDDPPVIEGQASTLSFDEDTRFSIEVNDLVVTDIDSAPDALSVVPQTGANYTVDGAEIAPDLDFTGALVVSVVVSDGAGASAPFGVAVDIVPVNDAPRAVDDSYAGNAGTTGNVELRVDADQGLLQNDSDVDGPSPLAVVAVVAAATVNGGAVDIAADGSFAYLPPVGFIGADEFEYTVSDGVDSAVATASIEVALPMAWFVDNRAGAGGDGRSRAPFDSLADAEAVTPATAADEIRVSAGDGTTAGYDQGIALKNGQQLIGDASDASEAPSLTAPAGAAVTLGNGNRLENLVLEGAGTIDGVAGTNTVGLVIAGLSFDDVAAGVRLDSPSDSVSIEAAFVGTAGPAVAIDGGTAAIDVVASFADAALGLAVTDAQSAVTLQAGGELDGGLFDIGTTAGEGLSLRVTCDPSADLAVSAVSRATFAGVGATGAVVIEDCPLDPTAVPDALLDVEVSLGADLCLDVRGNVVTGASAGTVAVDVLDTATLSLPGYAGGAADVAAAAAFVDGQNTNTATAIAVAGTSPGIAGAACP